MVAKQKNKQNQKHTERVIIGMADTERRKHLIHNAKHGVGVARQEDKDILLQVFVNTNEYKYVQYRIKNAILN